MTICVNQNLTIPLELLCDFFKSEWRNMVNQSNDRFDANCWLTSECQSSNQRLTFDVQFDWWRKTICQSIASMNLRRPIWLIYPQAARRVIWWLVGIMTICVKQNLTSPFWQIVDWPLNVSHQIKDWLLMFNLIVDAKQFANQLRQWICVNRFDWYFTTSPLTKSIKNS